MILLYLGLPIYFVAILGYGVWYEKTGRAAKEYARIVAAEKRS